jgi:tRNA nucleotidyltransferase (CCA-adding enzyme)
MPTQRRVDPERLAETLNTTPGLEVLREAAAESAVYLVGGAVRDLLLGQPRTDIDVAVEGDVRPIADALGGEVVEHERFATATVAVDGLLVDLAMTRSETYERPGALPTVTPATITDDLARRDFTINAMAVPLRGEPSLIDPHGGVDDLRAGVLRVLHERSFVDDPTRALRAGRYAARFDLELEPGTAELLRTADLGTVSGDRIEAELRRIATEDGAPRALELIREWGLLELPDDTVELAGRLRALSASPPWSEFTPDQTGRSSTSERVAPRLRLRSPLASAGRPLVDAILAASGHGHAAGPIRRAAEELARATPERPSQVVRLVKGASPVELLLARAMGAEWLDHYVEEWSKVSLEIDGADLLKEGIPEGPAVGRGLEAALSAKLDGEIDGRELELEIALAAARGEIPED